MATTIVVPHPLTVGDTFPNKLQSLLERKSLLLEFIISILSTISFKSHNPLHFTIVAFHH